MDQTLC